MLKQILPTSTVEIDGKQLGEYAVWYRGLKTTRMR